MVDPLYEESDVEFKGVDIFISLSTSDAWMYVEHVQCYLKDLLIINSFSSATLHKFSALGESALELAVQT